MQANVTEPRGAVVPTLRYRDVAAAIDWLCNAFGFDKHLVVSGNEAPSATPSSPSATA